MLVSGEEEERLLAASSPYLRPIIITALNTGMRKQEILGLTWDSVDFENSVIRVDHSKNGEYRTIPMNQHLYDTLKMLDKHSDFVFYRDDGSRFGDIKKGYAAALRRSGIKKCRFHDLRHTFASRLVMAGADLATVKELLGHKTLAMTMRYSHPTPKHRKWAVELLDLPKAKSTTISTTVPREESFCRLAESM